jgi:hypothetical protein
MDPAQQPQQPTPQQPVAGAQPVQPPAQPQPAPQPAPAQAQPAADPKMRIDENMLIELGLGSLNPQDKDDLLKQIYQTLEIRVGMKLAERMSDAQLKEFEQFINNKDDAGALKWLETNFPDYKQVVANELNALKEELKKDSDKILAAASQQAQAPAQPQPAPQQQQQPAPQPPVQPQQ